MLATSQMLSLVILLLASSPAVPTAASGGGNDDQGGLIHIPLYVHETLAGPNATVTPMTASPMGANSSFGSIGVVDDEVRAGRDRSSRLLGRFRGFIVGTSREASAAEYLSSAAVVFTAGEYAGSTVSVEGALRGSKGVVTERAGRFRLARGYSLTKTLGSTTPTTDVFQFDLFVILHRGKY